VQIHRIAKRACGLAVFGAAIACLFASAAVARPTQENDGSLPEGKGQTLVSTKCSLCHTLDRVVSTHRTKADWQHVVRLMYEQRAPFLEEDIPTLVDYLYTNFGKPDNPPPMQVSMPIPAGYDFSQPAKRGTINGTVTSDHGPVHAFTVTAHNLLY